MIAAPSRRYSESDRNYILKEISQLLNYAIIEESVSSWEAQVVVVKNHGKQWKTVNKFSVIDAYPLQIFVTFLKKFPISNTSVL